MTSWSDRLSPILVKELRQGIRSQLFTSSLLLVQALLFVFGLSFILSDTLQQEPTAGAALFWTLLMLPLLVLVPASASQAIEKEVKANTLELLLLTRLSSYRIVLGKWVSTVVQTTLLLVSAFPYVILRYFLGGIDIWSEIQAVLALLLGSALLAGIAMGFWSLKISRWAKWGLVLFALWFSPWMLFALFAPHGGLGLPAGIGTLAWFFGFILLLMMLEAAAARIGPASENHTSRLRLLALVALAAALLYRGGSTADAIAAALALLLVLPTVVGSLNELVHPVRRLYRPFLTGSRMKKLLFFPFAPSWPGGVAFAAIVLLLVPFLPAFRGQLGPMAAAALLAMFFLPAALVRTGLGKTRTLGWYLILLVLSSLPLYAYSFVQAVGFRGPSLFLQSFGGVLPPLALTLELVHEDGYEGALLSRTLLVLTTTLTVLGTALAAGREWKRIAALGQEAARPSRSAVAPSIGVALEAEEGSA